MDLINKSMLIDKVKEFILKEYPSYLYTNKKENFFYEILDIMKDLEEDLSWFTGGINE